MQVDSLIDRYGMYQIVSVRARVSVRSGCILANLHWGCDVVLGNFDCLLHLATMICSV